MSVRLLGTISNTYAIRFWKSSDILVFVLFYIKWLLDTSMELIFKNSFEDTKGVIRIRKSKDRQHNGQKKKDKRTNKDLQTTHI
jgi:hypothetical protein